MRQALLLILAATLGAQTLIPPPGIPRAEQRLTAKSGEEKMDCDLAQMPPALNYSLRYLSVYTQTMRLSEFAGPGHSWTTILKVTPFLQPPVYLRRRIDVPEVPSTTNRAETAGGFFVGIGHYRVDAVVYDERNRVCRSDWEFDVRGGGERSEHSVMPPNTVAEMSLATLQRTSGQAAVVDRLTVLVHAAPFSVRGVQVTARDGVRLTSAVAATLEKIPSRHVRLVVFNLDKRKEYFRRDDFDRRDLDKVADAIRQVDPGVVDVQVLQNKTGDVDFLADLINRERRESPSDLALFLGPRARSDAGFPDGALAAVDETRPNFYFINLMRFPGLRFGRGFDEPIIPPMLGGRGARQSPPPIAPPAPPGSPGMDDAIVHAVSKVKGKTFRVTTPAEFAKALAHIVSDARPQK